MSVGVYKPRPAASNQSVLKEVLRCFLLGLFFWLFFLTFLAPSPKNSLVSGLWMLNLCWGRKLSISCSASSLGYTFCYSIVSFFCIEIHSWTMESTCQVYLEEKGVFYPLAVIYQTGSRIDSQWRETCKGRKVFKLTNAGVFRAPVRTLGCGPNI